MFTNMNKQQAANKNIGPFGLIPTSPKFNKKTFLILKFAIFRLKTTIYK